MTKKRNRLRHPYIDTLHAIWARIENEFDDDRESGVEDTPSEESVEDLLNLLEDLLTIHLEVEMNS